MTRRGARATAGFAVACAVVCALAEARFEGAAAQDTSGTAATQSAPAGEAPGQLSQPPEVRPQDVPQIPRRGRGRGAQGANQPGRKARMFGHLMTLLTLAGAAGAGYAIYHVRHLREAQARLQDTIAGQARQLVEIKALLEKQPRG